MQGVNSRSRRRLGALAEEVKRRGDWKSWQLLHKRGDVSLLGGGLSPGDSTQKRLNEITSSGHTPLHKPISVVYVAFCECVWEYEKKGKGGSITQSELKSISVMSGTETVLSTLSLSLCCHPSMHVLKVSVPVRETDSGIPCCVARCDTHILKARLCSP